MSIETTLVFHQGCLIYKDVRSSFWFLKPFEYLLVQFPSCLLAGNTLAFMFPAIYLVLAGAGLFLYFQIKYSIFVEILSSGFYLVNSEFSLW